jgi:hypothetical protein
MAFNLSALTAQQQATAIYIGYYDRAPDPYGMDFWEAAVTNPVVPLVDIATYFAAQDETLNVHPFFVEPTADDANAFISELYLNLFNRVPDTDGLTFWSNVLQGSIAGTNDFSVGEIILEIIQGAQNSIAGQDTTTLLNKIAVATAWTDAAVEAGLTEPSSYADSEIAQNSAKSIIENVTSAASSVVAAQAVIATAFDGLYDGITVDLTPGADLVTLTRGSDTVTGTIKELSIGDRIIDPSTTDADVLTVEVIEDIASNVTVQNIETVALNVLSGDRTIVATNWSGVQNYQVIGEGNLILFDVQTTEPTYEFNGTAGTNISVFINDLSTTGLVDEVSVILSNGVDEGLFALINSNVEMVRVISTGDEANVLTNVNGSTTVTTLFIDGDAAFSNSEAFAGAIDAIDARGVSQADILVDGATTVLTGAGDDTVTLDAALTATTAILLGAGTDTLVLNDSETDIALAPASAAELFGIEFIKTTDAGDTDIDMAKSTSTPEFNIAGGSTSITLSNLRDGSSVRTSDIDTLGDINIEYRDAASDASLVVDLARQHDGTNSFMRFTNVADVTVNAVNGIIAGAAGAMDVILDETSLAAGVVSDVVKSLTINNNGTATDTTDDIILGDVLGSSRLETLALNVAAGSALTLSDMAEAEALTTLSLEALLGGEITVGDIGLGLLGLTAASTELDAITVTSTKEVTLGAVAANNTAGVGTVTLAAEDDAIITGLVLTNEAGSIDAVTLSGEGDIDATFETTFNGAGTGKAGYVKAVTSTNTGTVTLDITNALDSGDGTVITLGDGDNVITLDSEMDDSITGGAGDDTLILDGAIGSDTIDLGDGTDTLSFENKIAAEGIVINIGSTTAYLNGTDSTTASAAETVVAGTFYDSPNAISGDASTVAGVESVIGGAGDDNIFGSTGDDTLDGRDGNDVVSGGLGDDVLIGGLGADILSGGDGDDTFVYAEIADAGTYAATDVDASNIDAITDFVVLDDAIQLGLDAAAFGTFTFTDATVMNVQVITLATADYADLEAAIDAVELAVTGVASDATTAQAVVFTVLADATTGGDFDSLAAGTYLVINDDVDAFDETDTIINITGVTGTLTADSFTFA